MKKILTLVISFIALSHSVFSQTCNNIPESSNRISMGASKSGNSISVSFGNNSLTNGTTLSLVTIILAFPENSTNNINITSSNTSYGLAQSIFDFEGSDIYIFQRSESLLFSGLLTSLNVTFTFNDGNIIGGALINEDLFPLALDGGQYIYGRSGVQVCPNGEDNLVLQSNVVLPITLKSFTASKLEGNNALNWSTSSEVDASHFELERSFDLQSWTSIDKQAARGQNGIETSYSFVDQNIIAQRSNDGVCYYRLGMVDLDGSKKKSDIRSINLDPLTETYYQTFPNPAKGVINVQLQVPNTQANMTDLFLMDNAGRLHTKTTVSTNGITKIDVSDLPKGVYHLQVNTGTEMLSKKVILVEN